MPPLPVAKRNPETVVAHLCFVATEILLVAVEVNGRLVHGRLALPDPDSSTISFELSPVSRGSGYPPKPGTPVRLLYSDGEYHFVAPTRVRKAVSPLRWVLALPLEVLSNQSRLCRRHLAHDCWSFVMREAGHAAELCLPVRDLSASGMGLVFDEELANLMVGQGLVGTLRSRGGPSFRVQAVVMNIRGFSLASHERIAGCQFQLFGFENHAKLADRLHRAATGSPEPRWRPAAQWRSRNHQGWGQDNGGCSGLLRALDRLY